MGVRGNARLNVEASRRHYEQSTPHLNVGESGSANRAEALCMSRSWQLVLGNFVAARAPYKLCSRRKQVRRVRGTRVFSTAPAVAKEKAVE